MLFPHSLSSAKIFSFIDFRTFSLASMFKHSNGRCDREIKKFFLTDFNFKDKGKVEKKKLKKLINFQAKFTVKIIKKF
jgi:hypothetical protein